MDVEKLKEAFYNFDEHRSGTISVDHLRMIMQTEGDDMPDLEEFLAEASQFADGAGNIDYYAFSECMLGEE